MLQFESTQWLSGRVSEVPGFFAEVFEFLDGDFVTVREITAEKVGGVLASNAPGVVPIALPGDPFTRLRLIFADEKREEQVFYAPSHVDSPKVQGAGLAILEMVDIGMTFGDPVASVGRRLATHVYLDETIT